MKRRFIGLAEKIFISIGLIGLIGHMVYLNLFMPISNEENWKEVRIPEGSSYSKGISILKDEGIIKNEFVFLLLGRAANIDKKLRAGYYNLNTSMSPLEVFNR